MCGCQLSEHISTQRRLSWEFVQQAFAASNSLRILSLEDVLPDQVQHFVGLRGAGASLFLLFGLLCFSESFHLAPPIRFLCALVVEALWVPPGNDRRHIQRLLTYGTIEPPSLSYLSEEVSHEKYRQRPSPTRENRVDCHDQTHAS